MDGVAFFQVCENPARAFDRAAWEPCKLRCVDTVAMVCVSAQDAIEECDPTFLLMDGHVIVFYASQRAFEFSQFMVVGREQCFGPTAARIMQILDDCPSD